MSNKLQLEKPLIEKIKPTFLDEIHFENRATSMPIFVLLVLSGFSLNYQIQDIYSLQKMKIVDKVLEGKIKVIPCRGKLSSIKEKNQFYFVGVFEMISLQKNNVAA